MIEILMFAFYTLAPLLIIYDDLFARTPPQNSIRFTSISYFKYGPRTILRRFLIDRKIDNPIITNSLLVIIFILSIIISHKLHPLTIYFPPERVLKTISSLPMISAVIAFVPILAFHIWKVPETIRRRLKQVTNTNTFVLSIIFIFAGFLLLLGTSYSIPKNQYHEADFLVSPALSAIFFPSLISTIVLIKVRSPLSKEKFLYRKAERSLRTSLAHDAQKRIARDKTTSKIKNIAENWHVAEVSEIDQPYLMVFCANDLDIEHSHLYDFNTKYLKEAIETVSERDELDFYLTVQIGDELRSPVKPLLVCQGGELEDHELKELKSKLSKAIVDHYRDPAPAEEFDYNKSINEIIELCKESIETENRAKAEENIRRLRSLIRRMLKLQENWETTFVAPSMLPRSPIKRGLNQITSQLEKQDSSNEIQETILREIFLISITCWELDDYDGFESFIEILGNSCAKMDIEDPVKDRINSELESFARMGVKPDSEDEDKYLSKAMTVKDQLKNNEHMTEL